MYSSKATEPRVENNNEENPSHRYKGLKNYSAKTHK